MFSKLPNNLSNKRSCLSLRQTDRSRQGKKTRDHDNPLAETDSQLVKALGKSDYRITGALKGAYSSKSAYTVWLGGRGQINEIENGHMAPRYL